MARALIVDDSKTAQVRLKLLLKPYQLDTDIAFSAEEALGYLSYNMPDIIFLDHHMEGMDGLEALRIIKANPATAMIPVVMYTSEKGDVYVGQARALGALDILSKEIIHPANLRRLLSSLKIEPTKAVDDDSSEGNNTEDSNTEQNTATLAELPSTKRPLETPSPTKATNNTSVVEVKSQVARLFELHVADVRQQIADQSRFVIRHLRLELKNSHNRAVKEAKKQANTETNSEPAKQQEKSPANTYLLIAAGVAAVFIIALLGLQQIQMRSEINKLDTQFAQLLAHSEQTQALVSSLSDQLVLDTSSRERVQYGNLISALEWALEENFHFDFKQHALSEQQVSRLQQLMHHLDSAGFEGDIVLDINFGDICVYQDEQLQWHLADKDSGFDRCRMLSTLDARTVYPELLSLAFINFEQNQTAIAEGRISLMVNNNGVIDRAPPSTAADPSAWNQMALQDNRLSMAIIPRG